MKIVFMGTPDFAIPSLQKLLNSRHSVEAVVTAQDKERGRGKTISFTPVKEFALKNNLKVFTPQNFKDEFFIESMKSISPDLFVVVAFRILPKEVFTIPKFGSINLHGSLLPKYRGAAPIQWALINGEKETGVTTFLLDEKVDTGNILIQEEIQIDSVDDFGSLHDKMMMIGADVVLNTVDLIEAQNYQLIHQDDSRASSAPKITKEHSLINWNKTAFEIHNLVRGLSPVPGAYFIHDSKTYKIYKTKIAENEFLEEVMKHETKQTAEHSQNIIQTKKEIFIKTKDKYLQILEIQPEGRKRMKVEDFLRGYQL